MKTLFSTVFLLLFFSVVLLKMFILTFLNYCDIFLAIHFKGKLMIKVMGSKLKVFLLAFLAMSFLFCGCFMFCATQFETTPVFASEPTKTYSYEISNNQGGYKVVGKMSDETTYTLSSSATNLSSALNLIKLDGISTSRICFVAVIAGNDNLVLDGVSYSICGNLTFATISADACIQVLGGSNIQFLNATIANNGVSNLLYTNAATLNASSCVFTSENKTIQAENSILNFDDCRISSNNEVALSAVDSSINLSGAVQSQSKQAVLLSNATLNATTCAFNASMATYAVWAEQSNLTLGGQIVLSSNANAICVDTPILLDDTTPFVCSTGFNIMFSGQIGSADVLIVSNATGQTTANINVLNPGFTKRLLGDSLFLAKKYNITYDRNCSDTTFDVPVDSNTYFNGEEIALFSMESDVRNGFTFVGWALSATGDETVSSVIVDASNIIVYAVFVPIDYTITYVFEDTLSPYWRSLVQNNNPASYNYKSVITLQQPTLVYHVFKGFKIEDGEQHSDISKSVKLPYKNFHNVTITLFFELENYDIVYDGLTSLEIQQLNLITTYNIESPMLDLGAQNYLTSGKSFFGLKTEDGQDVSNVTVDFSPFSSQTGFPGFTIGQQLKIVVDSHAFYSGIGDGTEVSPYILTSFEQYVYLLTGQKVASESTIYINLGAFIEIEADVQEIESDTIENYSINGNGFGFVVSSYIPFRIDAATCVYSIFPNLKNCTILNMEIKNPSQSKASLTQQNAYGDFVFAGLMVGAENCLVKNVNINASTDIEVNFLDSLTKLYVSGLVFNLYKSVITDCRFGGELTISYQNAPSTSYIAGFSANQENSLLLNCQSSGNLSFVGESQTLSDDSCVYIMGFSLLKNDNLISNCISKANFNCVVEQNTRAVLSGFAVATGIANKLQNVLSDAVYQAKNGLGQALNNQCYVSLIWSVYQNLFISNCVQIVKQNTNSVLINGQVSSLFDSNILSIPASQKKENAFIGALNNGLEQATTSCVNFVNIIMPHSVQVSANKWYAQVNDDDSLFNPTFTLVVYSMHDKTSREYIYSTSVGKIGVITKAYSGYLVKSISYDREGKLPVLTIDTTSGDSAFVYVNYQNYMEYLWSQVDWVALVGASALAVLLLIIMFVVMYRKKAVNFVFDGKIIFRTQARKEHKFAVPQDKKHIMWFLDKDGTKPMFSDKMPFVFKQLNLYSFSDETRIPLERAYLKKQADKCAKRMRWLKENKVQRLVRVDKQEQNDVASSYSKTHKKLKPIKPVKRNSIQKTRIIVATDEPSKPEKQPVKKTTQQQLKEEMEKAGVQIVQKQVVTLKKQDFVQPENQDKAEEQ